MKRKKVGLIVIACLILFLALRESGIAEADLYQSAMTSSRYQGKSTNRPGDTKDTETSYRLTIKYSDQSLHTHSHSHNNQPPIEIEAIVEEPVYTGSYGRPLNKKFTMTYRCEFTTLPSSSEWSVKGQIEGEVKAEILGLCSSRKAKELAFEKAKEQIISSLAGESLFK